MKRLFATLLVAAACTGCATRLSTIAAPDGTTPPQAKLAFQNPLLDPRNGGKLIAADALQPGDILLTAKNGITSVGIRMFTLAPVSHAALYIGDGQVTEAVGEGVRLVRTDDVLEEESVVVAFRDPRLQDEHRQKIHDFALQQVGVRYNHLGVMLHAPFALERRLCELPLIPEAVRDFCERGIAAIQLGATSNDRFFCSQFVLEAYRHAGIAITDADPRMISPGDLLHMREGDVPSVRIHQALQYVGHLKYPRPSNGTEQQVATGPEPTS